MGRHPIRPNHPSSTEKIREWNCLPTPSSRAFSRTSPSHAMLVGLIADTHNTLDDRVSECLRGVDHILHAGDVCRPLLIAELEAIAPVTVVAGNNDAYPGWRDREVLELVGHRILLQHIVHPNAPDADLRDALHRIRPHLVVFGHSHRPYHARHDGVLYLNPGSAGAPRFGLPRTLALLELEPAPTSPSPPGAGALRVRFLDLDGNPVTP